MEFLVSDSKVSKIYQSTFLPKKRFQMMFAFSRGVQNTVLDFLPIFLFSSVHAASRCSRKSKPSAGAPGAVTGLTGGASSPRGARR